MRPATPEVKTAIRPTDAAFSHARTENRWRKMTSSYVETTILILMMPVLSFCLPLVINSSEHHGVLGMVAGGLCVVLTLCFVHRLIYPYFENERAVVDASRARVGASANGERPNARSPYVSGPSKMVVFCFKTKRRMT